MIDSKLVKKLLYLFISIGLFTAFIIFILPLAIILANFLLLIFSIVFVIIRFKLSKNNSKSGFSNMKFYNTDFAKKYNKFKDNDPKNPQENIKDITNSLKDEK